MKFNFLLLTTIALTKGERDLDVIVASSQKQVHFTEDKKHQLTFVDDFRFWDRELISSITKPKLTLVPG